MNRRQLAQLRRFAAWAEANLAANDTAAMDRLTVQFNQWISGVLGKAGVK